MNPLPETAQNAAPETQASGQQPADHDRRTALRRLGPMAILTPPAVMSLLVSKRASAESVPPGDPRGQ